MGRPPKKKNAIERAALELFAEVGIDAASVRLIAERAGVTEGALYRHHSSKDQLVRALFFRYFESYALLLKQAQAQSDVLAERIGAMVGGFLRAYDEDPKAFFFVLLVQHELLEEVRRDMANPIEVVMEVLEEGIRRGEIPEQDVAFNAQLLMGMVMQTAVGNRYGRVKGPLAKRAPALTEACLRVVGAT